MHSLQIAHLSFAELHRDSVFHEDSSNEMERLFMEMRRL